MPNGIKYSTGTTEAGCLRKGNMLISNNTADTGTTFFTGINPPTNGYTIYVNKASGGPSIYCPANDTQLINITNQIAGTNYTTSTQCFDYYYTQTDKVCVTQNYPTDFPFIVLDGLVCYVDASVTTSYPGSGTTWTDVNGLGPKSNGTLLNGPTYNSSNGGSIVLDGVDDYVGVSCATNTIRAYNSSTEFVIKLPLYSGGQRCILSYRSAGTMYIGKASGGIFVYYNTLNAPAYIVGSITNGSIAHCVVTCDATNNTLSTYINGTLAGSVSRTGWSTTYNSTLGLGFDLDGGTNEYMDGNFYLFRHYNKVLSQSEILQNYYKANIITSGLVFAVDPGNVISYNSGSSTAYSLTGSLNSSLINGTSYSTSNGGTWNFDGVDDYMITQQITGYKSLCFWVYWNGTGPGSIWQYLLDARTGMNAGWFVPSANSMGSDWNTTFYVNGVSTSTLNSTTVPKNQWLHIYLEGVNSSYTSTINFMSRYSNNEQAGGKIGGIYVYNRALSVSEIQQNYNAQRTRFGL